MIRATEISDATIPNGAIQKRLIVPLLAARRPGPATSHAAAVARAAVGIVMRNPAGHHPAGRPARQGRGEEERR